MGEPQRRLEECRRDVLCYLAERHRLAFPSQAVQRKLRIDGSDFTLEEVEDALDFLCGFCPDALVKDSQDAMGATKYFKATSAGVLFHERSR